MAYYGNRRPLGETIMISQKDRDLIKKRKDEYLTEMNRRLDSVEDSPFKDELVSARDHALTKFPELPIDLSIWTVAYYEDWLRALNNVPEMYKLPEAT